MERRREEIDPILLGGKCSDPLQWNERRRVLCPFLVLVARPSARRDQRLQLLGDDPPVAPHRSRLAHSPRSARIAISCPAAHPAIQAVSGARAVESARAGGPARRAKPWGDRSACNRGPAGDACRQLPATEFP